MSIYKKLSDARSEFHSKKLSKSGHNKFAGYKYFELSDFLPSAMESLRSNGLIGIVTFSKDAAYLRIVDVEKPDQLIEFTSPMATASLKGAHEIQNLGAVQTYMRRYLWVVALEIVEHDAIDSSEQVVEFDITSALDLVESCETPDQLKHVWQVEGQKAVSAGDKGGHAALKNAVKEKKAELEGVAA